MRGNCKVLKITKVYCQKWGGGGGSDGLFSVGNQEGVQTSN